MIHHGPKPVIVTPTLYVSTPTQKFGRLSTTKAQVVHVQHRWSGSCQLPDVPIELLSFCVAIPTSAVQLRDPTAVHPGKKYVPLRTRVHARFCFLPSNFGEFMRCHPYQRSAAARSHLQCTQGKSMSHHIPETMPEFVSSLRTPVSLCVATPTNAVQLRDPICNTPREQVLSCPQKTTGKIKSNLTTRHDQPFFERGKKSTSLQKNKELKLLPLPNSFQYSSKMCVGDTRVGLIMCSVPTTDTIVRINASVLPLPRLHHPLLQRYPSSVGLAIQDRTVRSAINSQVLRRNNRLERSLVLIQVNVLLIYYEY
jgi:hypothetical protein